MISKIDDFMQLDFEILRKILASDNISVAEEEIFEAAMKWIEYDEVKRKELIGEVLKNVRFTQIDSKVSSLTRAAERVSFNFINFSYSIWLTT